MAEPCTQKFLEFVAFVKKQSWEFPELKPFVVAQSLLECGRGTTKLFADYTNAFGMHFHDFLTQYAKGVEYDACDGKDIYACFKDFDCMTKGYFAWFDHWEHYGDWRSAARKGGEAFLNHIGPHYCPPGFTKEWAEDHGGVNYAQYICQKLLPEAKELLGDMETPMKEATWLNIANDKSCVQAMNSGDLVETFEGNGVAALKAAIEKHPKMGTWAIGERKKGEVKPPPPPSGTPVCLDSGHSLHKVGARSNSGTVREEILNEFGTGVIAGILKAKGIGYKWPNPDPDDLTSVGKEGWGGVKIMVSIHHNSYSGSGNPYVAVMVDVGAPMKTKLFAQKVARAITASLKGTPQETKIFEGTSGMEGVYEAELTVINASAKDPDGNPPIHILPELYFLNKFTDEVQCKEATGKASEAIARCIVEELQ